MLATRMRSSGDRQPLSLVASTTSTAATISAPSDVRSGDLFLLFDFGNNSTSGVPTNVVPTGFTQITTFLQNDTFDGRCTISKKVTDGTEDGATITGISAALPNKVLLQFRDRSPFSTATEQDVAGQMTDGDPTTQTCNASLGTPPLIVLACYGGFTSISGETRTFSTTADAEINSSTSFYVKYKIYSSSPADATIDLGNAGAMNALASFYIELA